MMADKQILQNEWAEDRFRALLETTPEAVVIVNGEGVIVLVNAQTVKLFGYSRAEILVQPIELLICERYRLSFMANLHTPDLGVELELYAQRKDESEFPVEINISPFGTETGVLMINYIRDMTKHVKVIEALAEERRLLHALMDNIPDLIYFKDTTSRFIRINHAHAWMLGANTPNEALGKRDSDFQDLKLSNDFLAEEANVLITGQSVVNREEFNPAPDGTPRWFSATKVRMKDSYGRITGIVGISHDITERKQMEEALRNSEEQFRSAFNFAVIGKGLVALDGRWFRVNQAFCSLLGYSESELLTKTFQDITHPDDLDSDLNFVRQLLAGQIESYQMEKRYLHKQGHQVWVLLSVSLVRDSEGQPLHFISQIQDISERRQAEAALAAERNLLRTLIDSTPDIIFIKDSEGRFILGNIAHANETGLSAAELVGKTVFDVFPPELAARFEEDDERVKQSGQPLINMEHTILDQQGKWKTVLNTKIPIRDKDGQVTSLVGIGRDITEQRQLHSVLIDKEKLQTALDKELELSNLKSRMMERISHEFRTPLTIIQMTTETFTSYFDRLKPEQRVEKAKIIQQSTQRLTDMLDGISSVIKPGLKAQSLHLFQLNLRNILDSCAFALEEELHLSEKFVLDLPDTIMVLADREIISEGLFPILQNAARYSSPKSPVMIQLFPTESGIELHISDKGIGILPNELPRIFDPFFRGSNINEIGGLGIGLTIAARAIDAHKGTIKVESLLDHGTIIKVWLP